MIEIQFMKIHFLKFTSLPLFLCDVCFVFKTTMIVYYTLAEALTGGVSLR